MKLRKLILFFIFVVLTVPLCAQSEKASEKELIENAILAYEQGNYSKCRSLFGSACNVASTEDTKLLAEIYDAKIILDENPYSTVAASQVVSKMDQINDKVMASKLKGLKDSYYAVLMQSLAIQSSWQEVKDTYRLIKEPDETCAYLRALASYTQGSYKETEEFLVQYLYSTGRRSFENKDLALLYANVLGWQKNYSASKEIYETYYSKDQLEEEYLMDYAKILYNLREYDKAAVVAKKSKDKSKEYFTGLCYINLSQWKDSYDAFSSYINKNGTKADYSEISAFYKAYSSYKLGKYKESYSLFVDFANTTTQLSLARQSYELAARSALLASDFDKAALQAENLVRVCFAEEEKQKAVIFLSQIYSDNGKYDKAVSTLTPYTNEKSSFALTCIFQIAQIYERAFNYTQAVATYDKIVSLYPNDEVAEDAVFKKAQLSYTTNDYQVAAKGFTSYISKYSRGKYLEEAYYLAGECYLRCKDYDKSINYSKNLVTKFPSSVYLYGANKNLFQAYYELGEYNQAQNSAKYLMNNFNSQAAQDGIPYQLKILNSIGEGKSKAVAEKYAEFEKLGGISTKNGRLCGYELFELYKEYSDSVSALKLAKELASAANSGDSLEYEGLGKVTVYIAENSKVEERPALYIKAAEYFKKCDKGNNAAAALYSAVEAFMELNQRGDARETASTLKKLYPDSRQAKNVDLLLK